MDIAKKDARNAGAEEVTLKRESSLSEDESTTVSLMGRARSIVHIAPKPERRSDHCLKAHLGIQRQRGLTAPIIPPMI